MTRFTIENTEGYTQAQLDELNKRYATELAKHDAEDQDNKSVQDAVAEQVQRDFN